jgi:hypothetical protein
MKTRLALLMVGIAAVFALAPATPTFSSPTNAHMRWDIISVDFATSTGSAGGHASAAANDGSWITLTGTGTFRANPGNPQDVTGGGSWTTFNPGGTETASGTYQVTGLTSFTVAPGTFPLQHDAIGAPGTVRAGLLAVQVAYSNGSTGTLTVSCHLNGTSDSVFEGVTASMGFVDYWNRQAPPAPPEDANRTNFHVVS